MKIHLPIVLAVLAIFLAGSKKTPYDANTGAIPIQHKMTPPPAKAPVVNVTVGEERDSWTTIIVASFTALGGLGAIAGAWAKWGKKG